MTHIRSNTSILQVSFCLKGISSAPLKGLFDSEDPEHPRRTKPNKTERHSLARRRPPTTTMLVRTSLALVWLSAMAALSNASCDLACPANAPCVEGKANFTDHPQPAGDEFDFHTTLSVNGQHCACPHYLTGVLCDVKFETCDGDHLCYNGGKCIPGLLDELGNEQLYCDCSSAVVDGVQYVGKWCEHEAENYCNDEETLFCLTGRCNVDYP